MRRCLPLLFVLVVPALAQNQDAAKDDIAKLQGKWLLVSLERDGVKVPAEDLGMILTIKGSDYAWSDSERPGSFKLDATKKPKTIDYTVTGGPDKGQVELAIYDIRGDTWTDCVAEEGEERPREFKAPKGSGRSVMVYRRVK